MKNIKAVVFDFGGVIELHGGGSILDDIACILHIEKADFKQRYFEYNYLSNVKNIPWEEMIIRVVNTYSVEPGIIEQVHQLFRDYQSRKELNTELISWFPKLKQLGYKTAVLSNATSELRKKLIDLGIHEHIDEVVISGEIGFQKPHKEAFDVAFQKLGVLPQEVIFIDDAPKSLEKAGEIGYTPILFQGNEKLKNDLNEHGISL